MRERERKRGERKRVSERERESIVLLVRFLNPNVVFNFFLSLPSGEKKLLHVNKEGVILLLRKEKKGFVSLLPSDIASNKSLAIMSQK